MDQTVGMDWQTLADAVPGCVAVASDGRFVHASADATSTLGREARSLVGESWRTLFDQEEVTRLERDALPAARADGRWDSLVDVAGESVYGPTRLTLTATDNDTVVWVFSNGEGSAHSDLQREPVRSEAILNTLRDSVYAIDGYHRFTYVNDALCELTGMSREDLLGTSAFSLFADEDERATAVAELERVLSSDDESRGTLEVTFPTEEGLRHLESRFQLHPPAADEFQGSIGVIRDVTERERRERTLERQRDELETLDRINELLLETTRELVETASRDAIERAVCERLARSDLYQFAWVGERELDGDRVVPRATAGEGDGYLDEVTVTYDRSDTGTGPAGRAMRSGDVQVVNIDDPSFGTWRDEAAARGFESVAAVPLYHGDTVYGVLAVYATRPDAFSEREQSGFDVLGRTIGFVIHAARSRELLFADAVVELAFQVGDGDSPLSRTATACGCTLELAGSVVSGDRWILYLDVDGAERGEVVAALASDRAVEHARALGDAGDGHRLEVVLESSSLFQDAVDVGGTVQTARFDPGGARFTVEVPADADVRRIVEHVTESHPDADLVARRERDREVTTVGRPGGILASLTDRQREVLTVAYQAGYYDWPRESTAQDVARALDLASSTLHGHLRKAEGRVLSALLDDE